jgi:hypothetical protein
MQKRTYEQHTPLAMAHLMGRRGEPKDEAPVRFRVQADRRQAEALAQGAVDRRVKRMVTSADGIADVIEDVEIAGPDIVRTK